MGGGGGGGGWSRDEKCMALVDLYIGLCPGQHWSG